MLDVKITVAGLDRTQRKWKNLSKNLQKALNVGIQNALVPLTRRAKMEAPVDTGYLRNNIIPDRSVSDGVGHLNSWADYSRFVEYGTSRQAPNPYMGRTYKATRRQVIGIVNKEVNKVLRRG